MLANPIDYTVAALTVWRESRGEPGDGQRGVMHVILNRRADKRWPDTIYKVCLQPMQFSCFNAADPTAVRWPLSSDAVWQSILEIVNDPGTDLTHGANHYHVTGLRPSWTDANKITTVIGRHVFYRL